MTEQRTREDAAVEALLSTREWLYDGDRDYGIDVRRVVEIVASALDAPPSDDEIEAAARAMFDNQHNDIAGSLIHEECVNLARTALAAARRIRDSARSEAT